MWKHSFFTIVVLTCSVLPTKAQGQEVIRVFLQAGQSNADGRGLVSEISPQFAAPQTDVQIYSVIDNADVISGLRGPGTPTLSGQLVNLQPGLAEPNLNAAQTAIIDPPEFGPEVTLGRGLADFYRQTDPNTSVAIIKYANGATNLADDWEAGGTSGVSGDAEQYMIFQNTVTDGLLAIQDANPDAEFLVSGAVWVQGKGDANSDFNANAYGRNLTDFINDFRLTYGQDFLAANGEELPFIIGEIGVPDRREAPGDSDRPYANEVRRAQRSVASTLDGVGLVEAVSRESGTFEHLIDVNPGDEIHFSASGQEALGFAFARQLVGVAVPEPSSLVLASLFAAAGCLRRRRRMSP